MTTLEYVVIFPMVLTLLALCVQAALYFFARSTALAAAQEGLRVARAQDGDLAAGQAAALNFVTTVDGNLLEPNATAVGGPSITVTVTGRIPSFLPGFTARVTQSSTGPKEKWTAP